MGDLEFKVTLMNSFVLIRFFTKHEFGIKNAMKGGKRVGVTLNF